MAQRKSTSSRPSAKAGTSKTRSGRGSTTPTARPESKRPSNAQRPAPPRKPGKSIVNQKQRPWGLITAAVLVVVFAAVVVTYAVTRTSKQTDPYKQPALADATKISGVTYRVEPNHNHV